MRTDRSQERSFDRCRAVGEGIIVQVNVTFYWESVWPGCLLPEASEMPCKETLRKTRQQIG